MLTAFDDYPIHQAATPVAIAGTDRNFYDRFFFNGYSPDGTLFFGGAMGILFLAERPTAVALTGAGLILFAILVIALRPEPIQSELQQAPMRRSLGALS